MNDWTDAGLTTGYNNTAIGFNSGKKITTGKWNTLIGTSTGQFIVVEIATSLLVTTLAF